MMPQWLGRQKDSEQVFPAGFVLHLMPHHQGFTSPIYLIWFGPPTRALLFMHYVKKCEAAFSFFSCTIYLPPPSCPPPNNRSLSLSPPPPLLLIFFPLFSGRSPSFHPVRPVWTGVCVCENLSEISLFRRLTASTDSEGTASSQDMKNASHKFVIRPWVIMAKAPITSD